MAIEVDQGQFLVRLAQSLLRHDQNAHARTRDIFKTSEVYRGGAVDSIERFSGNRNLGGIESSDKLDLVIALDCDPEHRMTSDFL